MKRVKIFFKVKLHVSLVIGLSLLSISPVSAMQQDFDQDAQKKSLSGQHVLRNSIEDVNEKTTLNQRPQAPEHQGSWKNTKKVITIALPCVACAVIITGIVLLSLYPGENVQWGPGGF